MNIIPTHTQTTALAAAVRSNTLTDSQREQAAVVLGMIGSALRVGAAQADNPASVAGAWQPVEAEFAKLLTATLDGRGVRPPAHAGGLAGTA